MNKQKHCCIFNVQSSILNSSVTNFNTHMTTKTHQDCVKSAEANKCSVFAIIFNNIIIFFSL